MRLLSAIMDRVDYRRINMAYSRRGRSGYSAASHGRFPPFFRDIAHLETLGIYGAFMGLRVENAQEPMGE